jgi:ATP synthase protein I
MANIARGVRKLAMIQLLLIAATSVVFFMIYGPFQAASACFGGLIAMANMLLLEWRRWGADSGRALSAGESIRLLYRTALERFVLVALLFAVALGVLQLAPVALITGFIAGQLGLLFTGTFK